MAGFLRHTGKLAVGTTPCNDVQDFQSHLCKNFFFLLVLESLSKSAQPFLRALRKTLDSEGLTTVVTGLRAVLRMRPPALPATAIFFWHTMVTKTTGPVATHSDGARVTDSAVNVPCFPSSSSEIGFGLGDFAAGTRFLHLAGQTHSIEAALSLSVLHREIVFHVPLFADITLPRRSNICVVLGTFSAHPRCVVSFPLSGGEGTILSSFTAD